MFTVGDIVYSVTFGRGTVVDLDTGDYGVEVEFDKGNYSVTYTSDGRQYDDCNQDLFFEPIPIPQSALERPRWRAKKKENYLFVNEFGHVIWAFESNFYEDDLRFKSTNYFQTMEEAKESKFYKVFHEELDKHKEVWDIESN